MAKISLALVFAFVVVVPFHSVLCNEEDQDVWMNIMKQAEDETSEADVAQDALFEAQKVIGDAAAQKASEDVLGGSWDDWVQKAKGPISSESGLAPTSPDDEEEDNLKEDIELAPTNAPTETPASAPSQVLASAPTEAPAVAPQAQSSSSSPSPSPSPSIF